MPEAFDPDSSLVTELAPSPNHGERVGFDAPDCVILHYTGMATAEAAIALLRDPAAEVSCHYVVEETGRIVQLVPESRRAWHAGVAAWKGLRDLNSASIGIEICNPGHDGGLPPYPAPQIEATVALCLDISTRIGVPADRYLGHSDIAPRRKRDPGERFPWSRLADSGLGLWTAPDDDLGEVLLKEGDRGGVSELQAALARLGYDLAPSGEYDSETRITVTAFQRHFRPARVDGRADLGTLNTLRRLSAAQAPTTLT